MPPDVRAGRSLSQCRADTLGDVLAATEVPAANEVQCGWGANHTLFGAQDAARAILGEGRDGLVPVEERNVAVEDVLGRNTRRLGARVERVGDAGGSRSRHEHDYEEEHPDAWA